MDHFNPGANTTASLLVSYGKSAQFTKTANIAGLFIDTLYIFAENVMVNLESGITLIHA